MACNPERGMPLCMRAAVAFARMAAKKSKKYIKTQLDALDEVQDELDAVDERFQELKREKADLRRDIKVHRTQLIKAGAEDQLAAWEARRGAGDKAPAAGGDIDGGEVDRAEGDPDAEPLS